MYGELADKLIQDARRTLNLQYIPLYASDLVGGIAREQAQIFESMDALEQEFETQEADRIDLAPLFILRLAAQRNKRCLIAHQKLRSDRLALERWYDQPLNQTQLSAAEQIYVREYENLVTEFKGPWTDIDLTGNLVPPREMYVEVRVLKDAGEVHTEYGVVTFTRGSQLFLKTTDVQRLVQQGYVEIVPS